ncbi:MAG: hypothetical protein RI963_3361 [Planctomycetota bacterium]|jgi:hypothetical protein
MSLVAVSFCTDMSPQFVTAIGIRVKTARRCRSLADAFSERLCPRNFYVPVVFFRRPYARRFRNRRNIAAPPRINPMAAVPGSGTAAGAMTFTVMLS